MTMVTWSFLGLDVELYEDQAAARERNAGYAWNNAKRRITRAVVGYAFAKIATAHFAAIGPMTAGQAETIIYGVLLWGMWCALWALWYIVYSVWVSSVPPRRAIYRAVSKRRSNTDDGDGGGESRL